MKAAYCAAFLFAIDVSAASASSYCFDELSCYVAGEGPITLKDFEALARRGWTARLAACEQRGKLSCWCKLELAREGWAADPLFVTIGDEESAKTFFFAGEFTPGKSSAQFIRIADCPLDTTLAFEAKLAYVRMPQPQRERYHFEPATKF
jgi:hypothetical protein